MPDSEELRDALKQIEEAILEEQTRPGGPRKWVVDGLRLSHDDYKAKLEGSGAIAQGQDTIAAGERAVVIRQGNGNFIITGNVQGNMYYGKEGRNPAEDLAIYRSVLAQTTASMQLRGLSPAASGPDLCKNRWTWRKYILTWIPKALCRKVNVAKSPVG